MLLPVIQGLIRRRILVNFRADPRVVQKVLPAPFRPKLAGDAAIVGVCLIRLEELRPRHVPAALGLSSENAAHRVAVTWKDETGREREGVYIPRRDTDSLLSHLAGGRIFPGEHHRARFDVHDQAGAIEFRMRAEDGETSVELRGQESPELASSVFPTLEDASEFFRRGSLGYSARKDARILDGITLHTDAWKVRPLRIEAVESSYFEDRARFPEGSIHFDCALIMRNVPHEWHGEPVLSPCEGRD